jgi:tape measure domain-containing protein
VLKADRLVKMLGAEQAAPVLTAQDKISSVVLRINRVLDALDRNDVTVLADLKGPLMDEINEARAALVALSKVQAAPVAELRGKLYAQLTRAMTVARQLDRMRAEPEVTLRERVLAKTREIVGSLRNLTSRTWTVTIQAKDKATDVIKRALGIATSPLALLGAGAGATAAIAYPLKLAGEMEQAQIAMEFFTGSAEKGQKFLERLQAFAAKTPFEFPDVRQAAIGLMPLYKNMYGVDKAMDETMRTIKAFGDAAGLTGAGIEGMKLALLGFKQIGTMGKLQMEELKQVTENLLIPIGPVLKELGLTSDALNDLGKRGIDAKTAMEAIIRTLEKNYKGGMEKMSQSLLGLISTVKDTANLTVWYFGKGMADPVKRILLDLIGLTDYTGEKYKAFQAKLQDAGRRVGEYFERVYNRGKRFWGELAADPAFQKMDFGDKLIYVLDKALDAVKEWLEGPGGKKVQAIFVKLGEIAATAWIAGIIGMVKGAFSSALHGNILGGIGLLLGAGLLGGGLLLRGAVGAGKGLFAAGKWATKGLDKLMASRATALAAALETSNPLAAEILRGTYGMGGAPVTETAKVVKMTTPAATVAAQEAAQAAKAAAPAAEAVSNTGRALSVFSKFAKVAGKFALPAAIGAEIYDIARAQDKVAATVRAAGGLGGSLAGAKLGALAGTAFLPGIGTVIGGALGGIGGYFAGRWLGGKAVDVARGPGATAQPGMNMNGYLSREVYEPFREYVNRAESWGRNLIINFTRGRDSAGMSMSGWLNSQVYLPFRNIVVRAESWGRNMMLNFIAGMQQVKVPPVSIPRPTIAATAAPVKKHAYGGILTRPHLGLVAEAGPEAIIPLSARMRSRALALYEETGRRLGVRPYAEGGFAGPVSVAVPAMAGVTGFGTTVTTGPVNVTLNISASGGQDVLQVIRANYRVIADEISDAVANGLKSVFQNMTK